MSNAAARYVSIGAVSGIVNALTIGAIRVRIFSLSADNSNASDRFLQLHNLSAVPTGGEVPIESFRVPGAATIIVGTDYFTNEGNAYTTGCIFAFSTTRDTYTAATASDHCFRARYSQP